MFILVSLAIHLWRGFRTFIFILLVLHPNALCTHRDQSKQTKEDKKKTAEELLRLAHDFQEQVKIFDSGMHTRTKYALKSLQKEVPKPQNPNSKPYTPN